jgi:hypothetical protein
MGGPIEAGLNRRARMTVDVLKRAKAEADKANAEFIVLGDLFDTSRPEPQLITAVQEALMGVRSSTTLRGNHDTDSELPGDNALGPLKPISNVIEQPTIAPVGEGEVWFVPFRPGRAADWFPKAVDALAAASVKKVRVLCFHLGISDEDTPPWLKDSHDSVPASLVLEVCRKHGIEAAFAGNWHTREVFFAPTAHPQLGGVPYIVQCGTLCPTGFDNPGLEDVGGLAFYDSELKRLSWKEIPGPRFLKCSTVSEAADLTRKPGNSFFVEITMKQEHLDAAKKWVESAKDGGIILDGEVLPDAAELNVATRTAATVARSAETLAESLDGFVKAMPLPEGVDRAAVLSRAKGYLGGS